MFSNLFNSLRNTSIVITGGLGYIGSNLLIELEHNLDPSTHIIVIDNSSNCKSNVVKRIKRVLKRPDSDQIRYYLKSDISDFKELDSIFEKENAVAPISVIFHLAAYKSVGESTINPVKYYSNNLESTLTLLRIMQKYNVNKLIFASSAAIYGNPVYLPMNEDHPLNPLSPYGMSKKICEIILKDECIKQGAELQCISLRYFNPVGGHPSGYAGEDCKGVPSNLMPYVAQVATNKREYVRIYGNDYNTKDGTGIRDYIHIYDLITSHVFALKYMFDETKNRNGFFETFNIGSGIGRSVLEVIENMELVSGKKVSFELCNRREGDADIVYSDISKTMSVLGWSPNLGIRDMCLSAYEFELSISHYHI